LGLRRRYRRHRGAYLPIRLGTRHAFDTAAFSILLVSTGAGIVAGEYLFALLSDRFGRRRALARQPGVAAVSLEHGLRGSVAAIDVIPAGTTQGATVEHLVTALRADRPAFRTYVTGSAAFLTDFKDTIAQRLPYALAHRRGHLHPAVPDDRIRGHPDQGPAHEHPCR
jgi:hypothetical protein